MRTTRTDTTAVPHALRDLADTIAWPDPELDSYAGLVTLHRALASHAHTQPAFRLAADKVACLAKQYERGLRRRGLNAQFRSAAQTTLDRIREAFVAGLAQRPDQVHSETGWDVVSTWLDHLELCLRGDRLEETPRAARPLLRR